MREAFRNIRRRKARSALTIFGVLIGVFALTAMGSLATSINQSIQSSLDYVSSRILVTSSTGAYGGLFAIGPQVPAGLAERAKVIDGVDRAYPTITLSAESGGFSPTSAPAMVYGAQPSETARDPYKLEVDQGRQLEDTDRGKVLLGSTAATKKKATVGDTVQILGKNYEVVGVLKYLNSDPDNYYVVTLNDARALLASQSQFGAAPDLVTNINVIPEAGVDTTALANKIQTQFSGTSATPPEQTRKQIEDASAVLNLIVLGSALVAVLVGSLSVINTMLVSVGERRKEIGLKRVVGARARHLLGEVILETGLIGLIGGILGVGLGALLVTYVNTLSGDGGGFKLDLTPELVGSSIAFAVVLGIVAGVYPAWRAIRIKPVQVLREE